MTELPPAILAGFEVRLERCRRVWEATGDPAAVSDAVEWTSQYQQTIAPWLKEAIVQALMRTRSKARTQQHRIDMKHFLRWRFLKDLKGRYIKDPAGHTRWEWNPPGKPSWEKAREMVSQELAKCGDHVGPDAVQDSYDLVQKDMEAGRGGKYFYLKDIG